MAGRTLADEGIPEEARLRSSKVGGKMNRKKIKRKIGILKKKIKIKINVGENRAGAEVL